MLQDCLEFKLLLQELYLLLLSFDVMLDFIYLLLLGSVAEDRWPLRLLFELTGEVRGTVTALAD